MGSKQYTYGGMLQDISKSKFPNKFYFEGKNIRIISTDDSISNSLTNEKGNELLLTIPSITIIKDDIIDEVVTLSLQEGRAVLLEWGSTYGDLAKYIVYRSEDNITYESITTVLNSSDNSYLDETTLENTEYFYKVLTVIGSNINDINDATAYNITTSIETFLDINQLTYGVPPFPGLYFRVYWTDNSINRNYSVIEVKKHGSSVWEEYLDADGQSVVISENNNTFEFKSYQFLEEEQHGFRIVTYGNYGQTSIRLIDAFYRTYFKTVPISNIELTTVTSTENAFNIPAIQLSFTDVVINNGTPRSKLYYHISRLKVDNSYEGDYSTDEFIDISLNNLDEFDQLPLEGSSTTDNTLYFYDELEVGYSYSYIINAYYQIDRNTLRYSSEPITINLDVNQEVENVNSTNVGSNNIKTEWEKPSEALLTGGSINYEGYKLLRYNVIYSGEDPIYSNEQVIVLIDDPDILEFIDTTTLEGVEYIYKVITTNEYAESEGTLGNSIIAGLTEPITNLTVTTTSSTSNTINWEDSVTVGSKYNLYRKLTDDTSYTLLESETTSTSYVDISLNSGLKYTYKVVAVNNMVLSEDTIINVTNLIEPITGISISNTIAGEAELTWSPASGNPAGYSLHIERYDGVDTITLESNYVDSGAFTDTGLTISENYTYYITCKYNNLFSTTVTDSITITT